MDRQIFEQLRILIHRESGICLSEEKEQLLANRLAKRLRAHGITSEQEYLQILETDATGEELVQLIDAVSTNVTYFYREPEHFVYLAELLRQWKAAGKREVKIWCAASSSGEEPYTMAMLAQEYYISGGFQCRILATDISTRVLRAAMEGAYEEKQLEKLPPELRKKYFVPSGREDEKSVAVHPQIRNLVTYRKLNLAKFPYALKGPVDVIFCRNVMIYFDRPLRGQIVRECTRILGPGGYLFLSHSENLLGIEHSLASARVAVFRKPER